MKPSEVSHLLAYLAGVDNRTPSEAATLAWADALDDDVTLDDAKQAAAIHRRETPDWVQPAHINAIVRRIQRERVQRDGLPPLPDGLTDAQERAWRVPYYAEIRRGSTSDEAMAIADRAMSVTRPVEIDRPMRQAIEGQSKRWAS